MCVYERVYLCVKARGSVARPIPRNFAHVHVACGMWHVHSARFVSFTMRVALCTQHTISNMIPMIPTSFETTCYETEILCLLSSLGDSYSLIYLTYTCIILLT